MSAGRWDIHRPVSFDASLSSEIARSKSPMPGCRCLSCEVSHLTQGRLVGFAEAMASISQPAKVVQRDFDIDTGEACGTLRGPHFQDRLSGDRAFQIGTVGFATSGDQLVKRRSEIRPSCQAVSSCH